jgi:hypothetical protein
MKKILQPLLGIALVLAISGFAHAQAPPEDGSFVLICRFYGSANQNASAGNKDGACNLPIGF